MNLGDGDQGPADLMKEARTHMLVAPRTTYGHLQAKVKLCPGHLLARIKRPLRCQGWKQVSMCPAKPQHDPFLHPM